MPRSGYNSLTGLELALADAMVGLCIRSRVRYAGKIAAATPVSGAVASTVTPSVSPTDSSGRRK